MPIKKLESISRSPVADQIRQLPSGSSNQYRILGQPGSLYTPTDPAVLAFIETNHLDLSKPEDIQRIKDQFGPTEFIELAPLEPVPIPQETPKLATPEKIDEIKEKQENGEKRPELGEYE